MAKTETARKTLKPYEQRFFAAAAEFARAYHDWGRSLKTCQDNKKCARQCNRAMSAHFRTRDELYKAANRFVTAERKGTP